MVSSDAPGLSDLLKRHAPFSIIERGDNLALEGGVLECSRTGMIVNGIVRESQEDFTCRVFLLPSGKAEATCTCSTQAEMDEQWCVHSIALMCKAYELGFFENSQSLEPKLRVNAATPEEIAETFASVTGLRTELSTPIAQEEVQVFLLIKGDVLGIRLVVRGETVEPGLLRPTFKRGLDTVLLDTLLREGSWDEHEHVWYVTGTPTLEIIFGILREYPQLSPLNDERSIVISREYIDALVEITWSKSAAKLSLSWVLPDESHESKTTDVLGTGPCWVPFEGTHRVTIYPLHPRAVKLAGLFPHHHTITLPLSQVGALLEILQEVQSPAIQIKNPDDQPEGKLVEPSPVLELSTADSRGDHFASQERIEVIGNLNFEYPSSTDQKSVVYLKNRAFETECRRTLEKSGFSLDQTRKEWIAVDDAALDFLNKKGSELLTNWKIKGLSAVKEKIRTAKLTLHVSVTPSGEKGKNIDWFDCMASLTASGNPLPLSTLFRSPRSEDSRWIKLDSGAYAEIPGGNIRNLRTMLGILDVNLRTAASIKTKLTRLQALAFTGIDDEQCIISVDEQLQVLADKLKDFSGIPAVKLKKGFVGTLRPYQKDGIRWLQFLNDCQLSGILADEMGLGKTVQTLAFLHHRIGTLKKENKKPTLVIAPTSVITNWSHESARFTPDLKVLLLHGPKRKINFGSIPTSDLVITSYALLRADKLDLEQFEFDYVILDEAQHIKNPQSFTTKAAKALRSANRLALTGTPTENRPLELWSIMDFLMPGYLGSSEFFKNNIERMIVNNTADASTTQFVTRKTKPFILRRKKSEVEKQLPPKVESTVFVEMTPAQSEVYSQILSEIRPKLFDAVKKKGVGASTVSILAALLRLRQVCNHPNSIAALNEVGDYDSGKFTRLQELLVEALENGRKILVYSQFREMLRIMREWVESQEIPYLYLDGNTQNRQDLIDKFNADQNIQLFLMSLKAGGTGVNLTGADTVIIYDPWWNPAVESQAVDRAHRIGQTKTVHVYRLVTTDSVEEKMLELKSRKSALVDALVNNESLSTLNLSVKDLERLFAPLSMPSEK